MIAVQGSEPAPATLVGPVPTSVHEAELRDDASRWLLDDELARVCEVAPTVPREGIDVDRRGASAVLQAVATTRASLAVVGCRGQGSLIHRVLGSVSLQVVHQSAVPVVTVR